MSRARSILLVVVLSAAFAAPARATEDGGTQSVFAQGAGNRATAMGDAFVAAVDDASALVWNPAGLGLVSRLELQAMQSGDLGLGMSESYAAFALPSWRWGAAGMAFRYFGVGGIEQRDSRNVLMAEDLRDSQLELAFGYGRAFGEAWSLGGAFKVQHQSLAGYSGSGLGLDLGLHVRPAAALGGKAPWAEGLSFGLAVRNALEPAVRLDRESVPDPLTLRTGLAWRTPTPTGSLLTELDVSRAQGVSPRLHAGLEVQMFSAAALRLGWNDRVFTAGTGLRYHDLGVDYAFEDNPIAPAHRVGVTLQFGATTDESRTAWRRREDEKVERRLADAFRQRQTEQVAELMRRAGEARTQGDLDGALEALNLVATLEPGRADVTRLELECLTEQAQKLEAGSDFPGASLVWERALKTAPGDSASLAGVERCRLASDLRARRSADVRARFGRAMDAFAAEDFVTARNGFHEVLKLQPDDADARRMLARTAQAMTRRAETIAARALRAVRAGTLDQAEAAIAEAQALDRDAAGVTQAVAALARARESASVRPPVPAVAAKPAPAPPPRMGDAEIEDLYQHGIASLRAGRIDDALRFLELVWSSRPGYREVAGYLKREYLTRGMEAFAAGRLDDALSQWERVLRIDPADERARGYVARAQEQRNRSREILGGGQ